jgi:hypothetical protein
MSKGSPIVPVRFEKELLATIDAEILRVNLHYSVVPYNRSSFIVKAVKDRMNHLARSRKGGKNKKKKLDTTNAEAVVSGNDRQPTR